MAAETTDRGDVRLPAEQGSVAKARGVVAGVLAAWEDSPACDVAVLLTSEVMTNAVVHGSQGHDAAGGDQSDEPAMVDLEVDLTSARVHVEVSDGGDGLPVVGDPDTGETSGRGMLLLDNLASDWGVIDRHPGKSVWFEVDKG